MRIKLFEKGNYLKDRIELIQHTDNMIVLRVNGRFEVMFWYKGHKLHHSCDCRDGSLSPYKLCAHVIAGINWICNTLEKDGKIETK